MDDEPNCREVEEEEETAGNREWVEEEEVDVYMERVVGGATGLEIKNYIVS